MNLPEKERKVILRKVKETDYTALQDAVFEIFRYDRSPVSGTDQEGNETTSFKSGGSGVYYIDVLPFGIYYLHETIYPDGVMQNGTEGWWYTLTVDETGINCSEQSEKLERFQRLHLKGLQARHCN